MSSITIDKIAFQQCRLTTLPVSSLYLDLYRGVINRHLFAISHK